MRKIHFRILLIGFLIVIYSLSIGPDITWANRGADGGDLITATYVNGISHPTGYPTYMLIAKLFQTIIPFGSIAFRTNLLSVFCSIIAAWLVFEIQLLEEPDNNMFAAMLGTLAFATSALVWSQTVITEVYTLHLAFIAAFLFLAFLFNVQDRIKPFSFFLLSILLGLGIGNHITTLFFLPILFGLYFYWNHKHKIQNCASSIFFFVSGLICGLSVYLILPFRAAQNPAINWGNPETIDRFVWLISAKYYQVYLGSFELSSFSSKFVEMLSLLTEQVGLIGIVLSILGLLHLMREFLVTGVITLWLLASFTLFSIVYDIADAWTHLLTPTLVLGIWLGHGVAFVVQQLEKMFSNSFFRNVFLAFLFILVSVRAMKTFSIVNARDDHRAVLFAETVMLNAPHDAILVVQEDEEIFTLWYYQLVLGKRDDIAIIAEGLASEDWYWQNLQINYPQFDFPSYSLQKNVVHILVEHNPTVRICIIEYQMENPLLCY